MAGTTRFILTNRLLTATVLNGSGGSAPALDETAPFTMDKMLTADRLAFYKSSATPTFPLYFDVDLGGNSSCQAAALHAYTAIGSSILLDVTISSSTAANGYPPVSGNPWTVQSSASLIAGPRDVGTVFSASASARYWRFEFNEVPTAGGQFSIGRLALGPITDLLQVCSPGYSPRIYRNRLETRVLNGDPVFQSLNANLARDFTLPLRDIENSVVAKLNSIVGLSTETFTMFDYNDSAFEVWLADMELEGALNWYAGTSASELWDFDLKLRGFA